MKTTALFIHGLRQPLHSFYSKEGSCSLQMGLYIHINFIGNYYFSFTAFHYHLFQVGWCTGVGTFKNRCLLMCGVWLVSQKSGFTAGGCRVLCGGGGGGDYSYVLLWSKLWHTKTAGIWGADAEMYLLLRKL